MASVCRSPSRRFSINSIGATHAHARNSDKEKHRDLGLPHLGCHCAIQLGTLLRAGPKRGVDSVFVLFMRLRVAVRAFTATFPAPLHSFIVRPEPRSDHFLVAGHSS